ncbi:MAG: flagellar biosynthesis anti-sigma factor FlgM [Eubacterium sp.]|nr:flagellar biosynthesis anti-sigma factor FlgM [Eubacterium sp.]
MRIDSYMAVNQVYGPKGTRRSPYAATSAPKDSLEISDFGNAYGVAKKAAQESEPVREDRVAEIKEQLANGTYNVPMSAVAEKMAAKLLG